MARGRLAKRTLKKVLSDHFDEGRGRPGDRAHRGLSRRSVAQTLACVAASGLRWPASGVLSDEALEGAL